MKCNNNNCYHLSSNIFAKLLKNREKNNNKFEKVKNCFCEIDILHCKRSYERKVENFNVLMFIDFSLLTLNISEKNNI